MLKPLLAILTITLFAPASHSSTCVASRAMLGGAATGFVSSALAIRRNHRLVALTDLQDELKVLFHSSTGYALTGGIHRGVSDGDYIGIEYTADQRTATNQELQRRQSALTVLRGQVVMAEREAAQAEQAANERLNPDGSVRTPTERAMADVRARELRREAQRLSDRVPSYRADVTALQRGEEIYVSRRYIEINGANPTKVRNAIVQLEREGGRVNRVTRIPGNIIQRHNLARSNNGGYVVLMAVFGGAVAWRLLQDNTACNNTRELEILRRS